MRKKLTLAQISEQSRELFRNAILGERPAKEYMDKVFGDYKRLDDDSFFGILLSVDHRLESVRDLLREEEGEDFRQLEHCIHQRNMAYREIVRDWEFYRLNDSDLETLRKEGCLEYEEGYYITGQELREEQKSWDAGDESKNVEIKDDVIYYWGDGITEIGRFEDFEEE